MTPCLRISLPAFQLLSLAAFDFHLSNGFAIRSTQVEQFVVPYLFEFSVSSFLSFLSRAGLTCPRTHITNYGLDTRKRKQCLCSRHNGNIVHCVHCKITGDAGEVNDRVCIHQPCNRPHRTDVVMPFLVNQLPSRLAEWTQRGWLRGEQ